MNRVVIICEGETEKDFCKDILAPYFMEKNIYLWYPLIKKSKGGIVKWAQLKREIYNYLEREKDVLVTTFIDYYGIYATHLFPKWEAAEKEVDKNKRMDILEAGMLQDIAENYHYRYLPYLQLHEFEALLFIDHAVFYEQIEAEDLQDEGLLAQTFQDYTNPELINTGKQTCPSKRLEKIILGYDKVLYGSVLAEVIGLPKIREKCPRFDLWLRNIEQRFITVGRENA